MLNVKEDKRRRLKCFMHVIMHVSKTDDILRNVLQSKGMNGKVLEEYMNTDSLDSQTNAKIEDKNFHVTAWYKL